MRRFSWLIGLGLILAGCGGGAAPASSAAPAPAAAAKPSAAISAAAAGQVTKLKVLLGSQSWYQGYAPFAVAQEMGYYKDGGVDPDLITCCGSTDVTKQIAAGQGDIGAPSPEPIIIGRQPDTGMKARYFYTAYRENIYGLAVTQGSPINKLPDLKGKIIGVNNLGSGAVVAGKALLKTAGLDPDKDATFVAIGEGVQAATAIQQKRVDALSLWDAFYAELEGFGIKFQMLDNSAIAKYPSNGLLVRDADAASKGKAFAGFGRALAQGTAFALENPEAAAKIMWKQHPDTKPANKPDTQALEEAVAVVKSRFHVWRIDNRATRKWGWNEESDYANFEDFMQQQGLIKVKVPVTDLFTNDLSTDINNFDETKVREQAKTWKG